MDLVYINIIMKVIVAVLTAFAMSAWGDTTTMMVIVSLVAAHTTNIYHKVHMS